MRNAWDFAEHYTFEHNPRTPSAPTKDSIIKKFTITVAGASLLAAASIGLAGTATAAGGADVTVNGLQSEGYSVLFTKTPTANLNQCAITNVTKDALAGPNPTAYLDVTCPDGC